MGMSFSIVSKLKAMQISIFCVAKLRTPPEITMKRRPCLIASCYLHGQRPSLVRGSVLRFVFLGSPGVFWECCPEALRKDIYAVL